MTPEVLYRVTIPEGIKIKDGYFQPHNPDSRYGNSIPMIHRHDLLPLSQIFANPIGLEERKLDFFVILAFRTKQLENIIDIRKISITTYWEYFAVAHIHSLINAMKFQWIPVENTADRYKQKRLDKSIKYLGDYTITPSFEEH